MTPPQEESKYKNAQFLQRIPQDVYFKKNHSILNLREFFRSEKYSIFTQNAVVAGHNGLIKREVIPSCQSIDDWLKLDITSSWRQFTTDIREVLLHVKLNV